MVEPEPDEYVVSRRQWAAMMLARDVETCEAIMRGYRVLTRTLDPVALRRAYRGRARSDQYLRVTPAMLDAIAEGGPFG